MTNAQRYLKDKDDVIRLANEFYRWYMEHDENLDNADAKHALQNFLFSDRNEDEETAYKEMEYSEEYKRELLATGKYLGIPYFIMNLGHYPTAYVMIPEKNPLYKIDDYDDMPIECHGGLSFCENELYIKDNIIVKGKIIGWDYAHYGDYLPYWKALKLDDTKAKKWTTEEVLEDVKSVIHQILEYDAKNIYPLTIINDRYSGVYSGAKYTAWNLDCEDVPTEINGDDIVCNNFWQKNKVVVGKGDSILEAVQDLREMLMEEHDGEK